MILDNVIYSFIVIATVITIVNYDHTVITIVNYDPKTFIVHATDGLCTQAFQLGILVTFANTSVLITIVNSCNVCVFCKIF